MAESAVSIQKVARYTSGGRSDFLVTLTFNGARYGYSSDNTWLADGGHLPRVKLFNDINTASSYLPMHDGVQGVVTANWKGVLGPARVIILGAYRLNQMVQGERAQYAYVIPSIAGYAQSGDEEREMYLPGRLYGKMTWVWTPPNDSSPN